MSATAVAIWSSVLAWGGWLMSFVDLVRKPSAFLPIVLSLAALALVVLQLLFVGVTRQADEGAAAHLFQLLLAAQLPIVAFFAIRWLPRYPRPALAVLALQAGAGLAALAPVFIMGW
jgi:hypothetical protein